MAFPDHEYRLRGLISATTGVCDLYAGGALKSNDPWYREFYAKSINVMETCIDPIRGTYNYYWQRNPSLALADQCPDLPKATSNACRVGNPVSPLTGQKSQNEPPDFQTVGPHALVFRRTYRSDTSNYGATKAFTGGWRHNWERSLSLLLVSDPSPTITALRDDGSTARYVKNGSQWLDAEGNSKDRIVNETGPDGVGTWQYYVAATDTIESYGGDGRLLRVTERNGWSTTLVYTTNTSADFPGGTARLLASVQNQFGAQLRFSYDVKNRLTAVTSPDGKQIQFGYLDDGTLTVTWPDQTVRRYHYGEDIPAFQSLLPNRLTGITDEKGVRFSTYRYNTGGTYDSTSGFITSEEHAGGVDKLSFSYSANSSLVTDSNALTRSFNYQLAGKLRQPTGASGSSPIGDPFNSIQYDSASNVSRTVDRNGSDTRYSYDALGRETQRIEGYGTADAKTTTTEWHPTWNLPLKVAAPGRVDYFSYDAKGQVLAYSWYPTNDANGSQGLNAQPAGDVTGTAWTYEASGLVATVVDRLGDTVTGQWTFAYDVQGNLASVTNGAGQTGYAVQYDAAGRLLEAVDVSGSRIRYVYDVRGRMTDFDMDGIHTRYEYDAVGQLVGIVGPYDLVTRYTYDAAHRLIQILDNITIPETVNDSSLVSPFTVEGAAAPSSLAYVSNRLASGWNVVLRWLKDWLSAVINSAHAQAIPLPNQYVPPIRPGQSLPAHPGLSAAPDLDPSLTPEKATPGMYVLQFLMRIQKGCGTAVEAIKEVFDMSKPPGDCDENEHRRLQDNVNQACDNSGQLRCKVDDVKEVLMQKMTLSRRCALARTKINDACFRGGDRNHRREAQKRWGTFDNCEKLFNRLN